MKLLRVFPRRTSYTPTDNYAFIGDPPLERPQVDEVHVSCTFTWDIPKAKRLASAWSQYYPVVKLGGPAFGSPCDTFTPGMYVKEGVTFTSRGCNNNCPWCLVPEREGKLRELTIQPGHIIQDNNLLQCSRAHQHDVFDMLRQQLKPATLAGGLDARLIDYWTAYQLQTLRIKEIFLAADTTDSLKPLAEAVSKLHFLSRNKLRCYVLIDFNGETMCQANDRLIKVWEVGCLPFAQLYQPPDKFIKYSNEWKLFARFWSRPAIMKSVMGMRA